MTQAEFDQLKVGDVIRWKRKNGSYTLRTIVHRGEKSITLPIRRRSWTGRITTTYVMSDVREKAEVHLAHNDRLMTDGELLRLCEIGFDIPQQLHRERGRDGSLQDAPSAKLAGAAMVARAFCTTRD